MGVVTKRCESQEAGVIGATLKAAHHPTHMLPTHTNAIPMSVRATLSTLLKMDTLISHLPSPSIAFFFTIATSSIPQYLFITSMSLSPHQKIGSMREEISVYVSYFLLFLQHLESA